MMPGASSMKMQYPSSGPFGRGQLGNRVSEPAEAGSFDPLIGRKVRTRWPDDNNFYEAVITDYNPAEVCLILFNWNIYSFFSPRLNAGIFMQFFRVDMLLFMTWVLQMRHGNGSTLLR